MGKEALQDRVVVSVVLPLYQPKQNWAKQFAENIDRLNKMATVCFNYIIVHDGPVTRELLDEVELLKACFQNISFQYYGQNRGKGYALRYGVRKTQTPFTIVMDFDFPYSDENIAQIIEGLQQGYDVVTGKRDTDYFKKAPLKRKIISKAFSFFNEVFFDLPENDTQSGLKGFNEKGKAVFLQTTIDRFLVDTEFLIRATKKSLSIKVIMVHLRPHVSFTNFGLKVLHTELGNLFSLIRMNFSENTTASNGAIKQISTLSPKVAE